MAGAGEGPRAAAGGGVAAVKRRPGGWRRRAEWALGRHRGASVRGAVAIPPWESQPELARQFVGLLERRATPQERGCGGGPGPAAAPAAPAPALPPWGSVCPQAPSGGRGACVSTIPIVILRVLHRQESSYCRCGSPSPSAVPRSRPASAKAGDATLEGEFRSASARVRPWLPVAGMTTRYLLVSPSPPPCSRALCLKVSAPEGCARDSRTGEG